MSTLSICTICQDEEEPIRWYLESCKHTYSILGDKLKEIVLVDGGSIDNTIDVIREYQKDLPIVLKRRAWDYTQAQQNFALDFCSGDYVFTPDADMTWTTNFPNIFLSNYFDIASYWDFILLFTIKDAYHFFKKWHISSNMRLHKRGPKWTRKYHVQLEGQGHGIPIVRDIALFENSCRIKNEAALLNRGQKRQYCVEDMVAEGMGPGSADRFLITSKTPDSEIGLISEYSKTLADLILPTTNG